MYVKEIIMFAFPYVQSPSTIENNLRNNINMSLESLHILIFNFIDTNNFITKKNI